MYLQKALEWALTRNSIIEHCDQSNQVVMQDMRAAKNTKFRKADS